MANRWGNNGNSERLYLGGSKITVDGDGSHEIKRCLLLGRKAMINLDSMLKSRDITLPTKVHLDKGPSSQSYGFSSGHVCMWELYYKESWAPKNWCFWPVVVVKILESPLDWNEVQSVHPKGDQSWILIGRTDGEAETPIFGHLMQRTNPGKDPDAGKESSGLEKGTREDEMVGWHHQLNGHEFE